VSGGDKFRSAMALLQGGLYNAAAQALRASVQAAETSATETTLYNDRSGYLRAHTKGSAFGLEGKLVADAPWAGFVENGTVAHDIVAHGSALSFVVNGERRFAQRVHHPGTKARPFMDVARNLGEQTLDYGLELMVTEAIERA